MTNLELKEKILESKQQEWFKTVSLTFKFPISPDKTLNGISAIYEYLNQQIDLGSLPRALEQSKNYVT